LGRWRTVLGPTDRQLYDEIVFSLWAYTDISNPGQVLDRTDSLYRFQELVQHLVSLERNASRTSLGGKRSGTRLDVIQRHICSQKGLSTAVSQAAEAASPIDIPETTGYRGPAQYQDTKLRPGDGFSLDEFLHLELFENDEGNPDSESIHSDQSKAWKDILPITVLLLASVAFSIVFTMVLGEFPAPFTGIF
jgi:hypothetical protein